MERMTTVLTNRAIAERLAEALEKAYPTLIHTWNGEVVITEIGEAAVLDVARDADIPVKLLSFTVDHSEES